MKYVYLGISFVCLVILAFCGYYFLGGFDPIEVIEAGPTRFSIAGKSYEGKYYKSDALKTIDNEIRTLLLEKQFNGDYAEVEYVNTGLSEEEVKLFKGILLYDPEVQVPNGFKVREFSADKVLAIKLDMFPAVRPSPVKIQSIFYTYAREQHHELQDHFVAIIFQDDIMEVYAFVKP